MDRNRKAVGECTLRAIEAYYWNANATRFYRLTGNSLRSRRGTFDRPFLLRERFTALKRFLSWQTKASSRPLHRHRQKFTEFKKNCCHAVMAHIVEANTLAFGIGEWSCLDWNSVYSGMEVTSDHGIERIQCPEIMRILQQKILELKNFAQKCRSDRALSASDGIEWSVLM